MAEPKFEKDLEKLEQLVEELEEGGLSLDDSLKRFEEGIKLTRRCEKALNAAEKKIEVLTLNAHGDYETEAMDGTDRRAEVPAAPSDANEAEDGDDEDDELLF